MVRFSVYPITPSLWCWEIRCDGALLLCRAAPTRRVAETVVTAIVDA